MFDDPIECVQFLRDNLLDPTERNFGTLSWDLNEMPRACFLHQIILLSKNGTEMSRKVVECIEQSRLKWVVSPTGHLKGCKVLLLYEEWERFVNFAEAKDSPGWVSRFRKFLSVRAPSETAISKGDLLKHDITEEGITCLVNTGLLLLDHEDSFQLSFPFCGRFINEASKGRNDVLSFIKRRPRKECPSHMLLEKVFQNSILTSRFILWDLLGKGLLRSSSVLGNSIIKLP
jgi:hypothetical protein